VTSIRTECVAEVLWELKKIDKLATYTEVAGRAGFKPGVEGKTLAGCLDTIRRDWPHLQWWRAIPDDCTFKKDCEHLKTLEGAGVAFVPSKGRKTIVTFAEPEAVLYLWEETAVGAATAS